MEGRPCRRQQKQLAVSRTQGLQLPLNLVWRQDIVRIQLLNVLSPSERHDMVDSGGEPTILFRDSGHARRFKTPRDSLRAIRRAVVHYDDLLVGPSLRDRRLDRVGQR